MFDIGWSELMVLGIIALIVIGPKDLPVVLRTIGRYAGMLKRQAAEFRAQFEEAIRETEYDKIKREMEALGQDVETKVRDASAGLEKDMGEARRAIEEAGKPASQSPPAEEGATVATEGVVAGQWEPEREPVLDEGARVSGKVGQ